MLLAETFAINMARELEMELFSGFTEKAKRTLLNYDWPGNIRELKNVVERAVYRCNNPHLPVHEIILDPFESAFRPKGRIKTQDRISTPAEQTESGPAATSEATVSADPVVPVIPVKPATEYPVDLKNLSQQYEIELIQQALADSQYNQKKTAEKLSLTYHQLRGYLKKYNLLDSTASEEE